MEKFKDGMRTVIIVIIFIVVGIGFVGKMLELLFVFFAMLVWFVVMAICGGISEIINEKINKK